MRKTKVTVLLLLMALTVSLLAMRREGRRKNKRRICKEIVPV